MKILLATHPFGQFDAAPLKLLAASGMEIIVNPVRRRLKESDMLQLPTDIDGIIAGTEPYTAEVIRRLSPRLKVIARAGIGLDNIDFDACRECSVEVTYTPDAPSQAVAELALAQMLNLARLIPQSDRSVRAKAWNRLTGVLLSECTIGLLGLGRIGSRVARLLQPFGTRVIAHELKPDHALAASLGVTLVDFDSLLRQSDILSLHIPGGTANHNLIGRGAISRMKTGAVLVNTARGSIVDEEALADALLQEHLAGAALDVFHQEPYEGIFSRMDKVILTAHIGASTRQSRHDMEFGAAEDCLRVLNGLPALRPTPESEMAER
ncbi:MAG: hypothetical protein RL095_1352 [Verrucomicrobiota bacterium]|jgi:D-3-phosphoglycerate dehydrogenase